MENATKALIIAAVILIVIVLIALAVRILGAAGQASRQTDAVSSEVDTALDDASGKVTDAISGLDGTGSP